MTMSAGKENLSKLTVPAVFLTVKGNGESRAVDASDVDQGGRNDCFLMAAMASIVHQHPNPDAWLKEIVKDNGDGTFNVTFKDGTEVKNLRPTFAGGAAVSDDPKEMWPALIEKAYGRAYGDRTKEEQFALSQGGVAGVAMEKLTGQPSVYHDPAKLTIEVMAALQTQGQAITASTHLDPTQGVDPLQITNHHPAYKSTTYGEALTQWHVYYVDRVDTATGTVVMHNPDSTPRKDITIPFEEFQQVFRGVTTNAVGPAK